MSSVTAEQGVGAWGPADGRRLLVFTLFVNLLLNLDRQVMAALFEPIRHEFGLSDSQLGVLGGIAYSGVAVFIGLPAGMLADKVSRKRVIAGALALWSAFAALCGAANGYVLLLAARMGVGAAEAPASPACFSMIADAFPKERQAGAIGLYDAMGSVGTLISYSAGAWIAEHYGWRWAFFLAAAPAVIFVPLILKFLKEPARSTLDPSRGSGLRPALVTLMTDWRLSTVIIGNTISALCPAALMGWATSLLIRGHGVKLSEAGFFVSLASGVFLPLGQLVGGRIGDRMAASRPGSQMWFAASCSLIGAAFGVVAALSQNMPLAIAALWCASFSMTANMGATFALMMQLAPKRSRATVFGLVGVVGNLVGYGGGPFIVGTLSDLYGGDRSLSYAIATAMSLALVPGILFTLIGRSIAANTPVR